MTPTAPLTERQRQDGRYALAGLAYARGEVRLVSRDLAGCTHLVTTRHGLFAINGLHHHPHHRRIAHGLFYGMTITRDAIYLFEAGDRPRHATRRGRIVRLVRENDKIVAADVIATELDNGCHQIDMIDGALHVVDTYNQQIVVLTPDGVALRVLRPLPLAADGANYVHLNSLLAIGERRLLLLHNGGGAEQGRAGGTGPRSEVAVCDADWRLVARTPLDGHGCHSFAQLEDGTLLSCGSLAGELIGSDGTRVALGGMMTRGLSVDAGHILVGGSTFSPRDIRDEAGGMIYMLDRAYRLYASLPMPAPVMDIRRIDGCDRSLSPYLAACATPELPT